MEGFFDELDQSFLTLDFGQGQLDFQVDTAFFGALFVGEELFDASTALRIGDVEADLAGVTTHLFPLYSVKLEWLGETIEVGLLNGPGKECLLGLALLSPHRLEIDYGQRTVELIPKRQ